MAGDPGVEEELVLVDQIQPVQLGRELAATEVLKVKSPMRRVYAVQSLADVLEQFGMLKDRYGYVADARLARIKVCFTLEAAGLQGGSIWRR